MNEHDIADAAALTLKQVRSGMKIYSDNGMVHWREDVKAWAITRWEERQFESSYSRPGIPDDVRQAVFSRDNFECVECGADENLSIDHVIPYSKGGEDVLENLQTLCSRCNNKKGNRERQRRHRERSRNEPEPLQRDGVGHEVTPPYTETDHRDRDLSSSTSSSTSVNGSRIADEDDDGAALQRHFESKGYPSEDVAAVVERWRLKRFGDPVRDPAAWFPVLLDGMEAARAKADAGPIVADLDGVPHELIDGQWKELGTAHA